MDYAFILKWQIGIISGLIIGHIMQIIYIRRDKMAETDRSVELLKRLDEKLKHLKNERAIKEKIITLKELINDEEEKIKDMHPSFFRKLFKRKEDF
jgi:hypothetical protein